MRRGWVLALCISFLLTSMTAELAQQTWASLLAIVSSLSNHFYSVRTGVGLPSLALSWAFLPPNPNIGLLGGERMKHF
jgi:hypothetical protein